MPGTPPPSSFEARLVQLRDAWEERRDLGALAHAGDAGTSLELLRRLHAWATECAAAITRVYGASLPAAVSAPPTSLSGASFSFAVGGEQLTFSLVRRGSGGWRVAARSAGGPALAAVGPSRRDGSWTRARFEDLVFAHVSAIERRRAAADPPAGPAPGDRPPARPYHAATPIARSPQ